MKSWILELFITLSIIQVCRAPWASKKYSLGPPDNPKNPNLGRQGCFRKLTEDDNGPGPEGEDNEIRHIPTPSPPHNHHHHHHHHHHHPHRPHRGSYGLSCFGGSSSDNEVEGSQHCDCEKKSKHKKSKKGKTDKKSGKAKSGNHVSVFEEDQLPFPPNRHLFLR